jgi:hypothetical protein
MERGEIDGACGWDWASFKSQRPDWLRDNKVNVLLQDSLEPNQELTKMGVPHVWQYVRTEETRKVVELVIGQQAFQRSYIAPPGVAPDALKILRTAFDDTMKDPPALQLTPRSPARSSRRSRRDRGLGGGVGCPRLPRPRCTWDTWRQARRRSDRSAEARGRRGGRSNREFAAGKRSSATRSLPGSLRGRPPWAAMPRGTPVAPGT